MNMRLVSPGTSTIHSISFNTDEYQILIKVCDLFRLN